MVARTIIWTVWILIGIIVTTVVAFSLKVYNRHEGLDGRVHGHHLWRGNHLH